MVNAPPMSDRLHRPDRRTTAPEGRSVPRAQLLELAGTLAAVSASTGLAWALFGREALPDVAMVQLLGVVIVAMYTSLRAAILSVILSVLSYDFFFVPPYLSLRVQDGRHVLTFGIMFVVGVVISTLTQRIREQASLARAREERTARLYAMTRELSSARSIDRLGEIATRHLHAFSGGPVVLLVPGAAGELERCAGVDPPAPSGGEEMLFLPLHGSLERVGVLGVSPDPLGGPFDPEQRHVLETFAAQIAGALERARASDEADRARLEIETERLRSSLLSSVSHDLRTPLAVITGAASTLLGEAAVDPVAARDLLSVIREESTRLSRLVGNLLDMTRLTAGATKANLRDAKTYAARGSVTLSDCLGTLVEKNYETLTLWDARRSMYIRNDCPREPSRARITRWTPRTLLRSHRAPVAPGPRRVSGSSLPGAARIAISARSPAPGTG